MTDRTPTRVLQVVLSLDPGGTERLVLDLTTRLHEETAMRVCCLDREGAWAAALADARIGVDVLGRRPGFNPQLGARIAAIARAHRATVIHAHHYSPFVYAAIARCFSPRVRLVFTEHGRVSDAPPSAKRRVANRLVLSHLPTRVFAVSEDLKRHIVLEGFNREQVDVIYNGIDVRPAADASARMRIRRALGVLPDTLLIGTIARLDPVKDLATLLRAAAIAGHRQPTAVAIVGDGPERGMLEALAAQLSIAPRVTFLGHRDDARDWLAGCDIFVNSSISEGVSLTILEAMAAGLPIVATAVGGTPEVVTETCGWLVPPRDPQALADAILVAGADPNRRDAVGRAARARVDARFTLDRMVREYRDVYRGTT